MSTGVKTRGPGRPVFSFMRMFRRASLRSKRPPSGDFSTGPSEKRMLRIWKATGVVPMPHQPDPLGGAALPSMSRIRKGARA